MCKTKTAYKLFKFANWKRLSKPVGNIIVGWNVGSLYIMMFDFISYLVIYYLHMLCMLVLLRIFC
jgi:hypothetical protein